MLRDASSLNLDAAENYPTRAVSEAVEAPVAGTLVAGFFKFRITHATDAEGYPGKRYHGGKQILDEMELLCWRRALETFDLDATEWGVNVQGSFDSIVGALANELVLSGSLANVFSYIALLEPGDVVMGLELSHGGHLSHGYQTPARPVSETVIRFKSVPYHVSVETGIIDYDELEMLAEQHKPRIINVGASAYSRLIDYERVRQIATKVGSLVHCDMAHFCGLVAAAAIPSPFSFCDLVTTTTSKKFRGPDAAMIFFKKWMEGNIYQTIFPRFQAGADHGNIIALAVGLLQARTPESKRQQRRIIQCAQTLANKLATLGYRLSGGGTDTHLILMDLRYSSIQANRVERILELVHIHCNRNLIAGDELGVCSGLRLGSAPMVVRGMDVQQFIDVAELIHEGIAIAKALSAEAIAKAEAQKATNPKSLRVFLDYVGDGNTHEQLKSLRIKVCSLAERYPPPWKLRDS